jgi:4'-phosphopantetheinyl transferase
MNGSGLIPLTPAEIHLWLASDDEITEAALEASYRALLNVEERAQERRFYFAKDRRRYLITRALVRTTLSRYLAVRPEAWLFARNAYGCPEIVNAQARDGSLSFNISHTSGLIVLGVTRQRALGVDVENVCARRAAIELAVRYFAPPEVAALRDAPAQHQQDRFFEYWTFKESYIKARRMGLALPLDKVSFHYPDDQSVAIAIDSELVDEAARWQLWQLRPTSRHVLAICAERLGTPIPSLIVRQTVPMMSDTRLAVEPLRMSPALR